MNFGAFIELEILYHGMRRNVVTSSFLLLIIDEFVLVDNVHVLIITGLSVCTGLSVLSSITVKKES